MSYTVKRQREIKCFQFPLEGSSTGFVSDVGGESVPCGGPENENALAKFIFFIYKAVYRLLLSTVHWQEWQTCWLLCRQVSQWTVEHISLNFYMTSLLSRSYSKIFWHPLPPQEILLDKWVRLLTCHLRVATCPTNSIKHWIEIEALLPTRKKWIAWFL